MLFRTTTASLKPTSLDHETLYYLYSLQRLFKVGAQH